MKNHKHILAALAVGALILGGYGVKVARAQGPGPTPTPEVQEGQDVDDQVQDPSYSSSIAVDEGQFDGMSESDEGAALQSKAGITPAEAEAAALAANPGATVVETELDNENGALVYGVELSSGVDVKVDAGNGAILHTESGGDHQDGPGGEANEAMEDSSAEGNTTK